MADEADQASVEMEMYEKVAIAAIRANAQRRTIEPKGCCHNCLYPFEGTEADVKLFCDDDCETDYTRLGPPAALPSTTDFDS